LEPVGAEDPLAELAARGELDERRLLVLRLGEVAHRFGCSTPRVEQVMAVVAERLGLRAQFFAQPTSLFAAFGVPPKQATVLLRFEPGEVDLERRWRMDAAIEALLAGRLRPGEALAELERIERDPPRFGPLVIVLAFALAAVATARFFGGSLPDLAASGLCGALCGLVSVGAERSPAVQRLHLVASATAVSLLTVLLAAHVTPLATYTVTVSGLIALLPGLTLTTAVSELALRHLSAGTARLTSSLMAFLELGFGVALGRVAARALPPLTEPAAVPLDSPWSLGAALLAFPLAFTVLLRARPRDLGWIAVATTLAFAGARLGAHWLGPELGAFLGALLVGLGSSAYGRRFQRPSAVPMLPGILMLVPGSLGFRSLSSLVERDVLSGLGTAFAVGLVAISLVAGLLVASAILPPRRLDSPGA
jgi:uncharacterized membrane protein YjjP (DUF1212 family)